MKESNVMTKTFQVVEVGPPDTDVSDHTLNAIIDDLRPASVVNTRSSWSSKKRVRGFCRYYLVFWRRISNYCKALLQGEKRHNYHIHVSVVNKIGSC